MADSVDMQNLIDEYKGKVEKELGVSADTEKKEYNTREYEQFRSEFMPHHMSFYEKACKISGDLAKLKPDKNKEAEIIEAINVCHLNVTPMGVASFAILGPLIFILFGSLLSFMVFQSGFFVFFCLVIGASMIGPLGKLPKVMANNWRLKASNQMVLCIFYVVTYMRHTSNIEGAIEFASDHLAPPLSLDLKKVLWDVETEKYGTVQDSLNAYLESWKNWNQEFIEAFHLIESSLYESADERRLASLDKSLDVILDETYEKMLHYAQNLKSPITMLHMLGVILPILGLVILPLAVSFVEGIEWYHIASMYNIALPAVVYYMGRNILSSRPTGYGDTDIAEENPELKKFKSMLIKVGKNEIKIDPGYLCIFVGVVLLLIGFSPLILHFLNPYFDVPFGDVDETSGCGARFCLLGFTDKGGPYGLGATILSLFVTLGAGASIGLYFKLKSKNVIKIRDNSKKLESEFASALFQLGNRLGDGLPAEVAVGRVAESMEGTVSGSFFQVASQNIIKGGMGVEQAIFDPKHGALVYFPSSLIESSMKVLIESVKKGPTIAAQALMNVSRYIKEIHKVNERLKDLMSDVISSMKSQIKFLTPVISGIVVGITSMIGTIIGKLSAQLAQEGSSGEGMAFAQGGLFQPGVPTFYFQIIVGIYIVQIIYVLTVLTNGIENGADTLSERFAVGRNLLRSTILYCVVSFAIILLFNMIAGEIMGSALPSGY